MFDNNNQGQSAADPVREAMRKARVGIGTGGIPEGEGIFEVDRLHPGMSERSGGERLQIRFICISHEKAENVGKAFEHHLYYSASGKRTLSMVLSDFRRFLIVPFGPDAVKAIESPQVETLIVDGFKERFATVCKNQGITLGDGTIAPYKGKRVKLTCEKVVGKKFNDKTQALEDKTYYNTYCDLPPVAA